MINKEVKNRIIHALSEQFGEREANSMAKIYMEDVYQACEIDSGTLELHIEMLLSGYPVQYLAGKVYFYDRFYKVTEDTLIPRPETEELVDKIIKDHKHHSRLRVLDIGTGTGCIAISLFHHLQKAEITAVDVDAAALSVAEKNAELYKSKIHFINMDFLIPDEQRNLPVFDIIVSNPPYISKDESDHMDLSVLRFEPHTALFATGDALEFYKEIAVFSHTHLAIDGWIYVEINEFREKAVVAIFESKGYFTETIYDMQGKPRVIISRKTNDKILPHSTVNF